MPSLISAKHRGKFRPQRGEVPKRRMIVGLPGENKYTLLTVAYGEKVEGRIMATKPAAQTKIGCVAKSGIGTAHHLRRMPVFVSATGQYAHESTQHRLERVAKWIAGFIPGSKPVIVDGGTRIKIVLWADEVQQLRYRLLGNYKIS